MAPDLHAQNLDNHCVNACLHQASVLGMYPLAPSSHMTDYGFLEKTKWIQSHSKLIFQKLNLNLELGKVQCSNREKPQRREAEAGRNTSALVQPRSRIVQTIPVLASPARIPKKYSRSPCASPRRRSFLTPNPQGQLSTTQYAHPLWASSWQYGSTR